MAAIEEPELKGHNSHPSYGRAPSNEETPEPKQVDAVADRESLQSDKGGSIVAESNREHCHISLAQPEQGNVSVNAHSTTTTQSRDHATNKVPLNDEDGTIFDMESPAHAEYERVPFDDDSRRFYSMAKHFDGSSSRSTMKIVRGSEQPALCC